MTYAISQTCELQKHQRQ